MSNQPKNTENSHFNNVDVYQTGMDLLRHVEGPLLYVTSNTSRYGLLFEEWKKKIEKLQADLKEAEQCRDKAYELSDDPDPANGSCVEQDMKVHSVLADLQIFEIRVEAIELLKKALVALKALAFRASTE